MYLSLTARAVLWGAALCGALTLSVAQAGISSKTLSLQEAFARTLDRHPELKRTALRKQVLDAEAEVAAQRPPLVLGLGLENALGSGDYRALDGAELDLSLGSTLEHADKRHARSGIARSQLAGLDIEAEARRLDLLAEVARRYLDVLAAQAETEALRESLQQRRDTVVAATRRVTAGASPRAVQLTSEAAVSVAALALDRATEQCRTARRRLALLWGESQPDFIAVTGKLLTVPVVPEFDVLASLLERTPELQRFSGEARVREARLQLAQSQAHPDLDWQVGLRRLQDSDDWSLTAGLTIPLGSRSRAQPGLRAAQAELQALALEREADAWTLHATLAEAHGRLRVEALVVQRISDSVIPALKDAETSAAEAYRAGALSRLEWSQLQVDLLAARRDRIAAAREFHRALIEIQRLTAEPFVLAESAHQDATP